MREQVREAVMVITGASSGIGRATAHAFAEQGATVVLAARRGDLLRTAERECIERGGRALPITTDITDAAQVEALARKTIETCGRIDVWVNNAGVGLFGRIDEVPLADYERVVQTNLFGCVYAARAVIPQFRQQGSGVMINVASVVGAVAQPYTSAYSASKWGLRGLGENLRMELLDTPGVDVCTVLPATIDTPFFQHAANFTGRAVRAMEPVYPAGKVAAAIVDLAQHPRREVTVGGTGRLFAFQHAVAPAMAEKMMARQVESRHLAQSPAEDTHGNLFEPMEEGATVSGGWQERAAVRGGTPVRALAGAALVALAFGIELARRRRSAHGGPALRESGRVVKPGSPSEPPVPPDTRPGAAEPARP